MQEGLQFDAPPPPGHRRRRGVGHTGQRGGGAAGAAALRRAVQLHRLRGEAGEHAGRAQPRPRRREVGGSAAARATRRPLSQLRVAYVHHERVGHSRLRVVPAAEEAHEERGVVHDLVGPVALHPPPLRLLRQRARHRREVGLGTVARQALVRLLLLLEVRRDPVHGLLVLEHLPQAVRGDDDEGVSTCDGPLRNLRLGYAPHHRGEGVAQRAAHVQARPRLGHLLVPQPLGQRGVRDPERLVARHLLCDYGVAPGKDPLRLLALQLVVLRQVLRHQALPLVATRQHRPRVSHPRDGQLALVLEHHRRRRPARPHVHPGCRRELLLGEREHLPQGPGQVRREQHRVQEQLGHLLLQPPRCHVAELAVPVVYRHHRHAHGLVVHVEVVPHAQRVLAGLALPEPPVELRVEAAADARLAVEAQVALLRRRRQPAGHAEVEAEAVRLHLHGPRGRRLGALHRV
mmetsp:Transcript_11161/g.38776  ORF Transcript_11161/g.38776 Transcript_11161/m.38776 type:complete len:460 (+) Transcript_11161:1073-2452(+)